MPNEVSAMRSVTSPAGVSLAGQLFKRGAVSDRDCVKTRDPFRVRAILKKQAMNIDQNRIYGLRKCSAKSLPTPRSAFSHSLDPKQSVRLAV